MYFLCITAECFGGHGIPIIRLYTELYKENNLCKSYGRDLGLKKKLHLLVKFGTKLFQRHFWCE